MKIYQSVNLDIKKAKNPQTGYFNYMQSLQMC